MMRDLDVRETRVREMSRAQADRVREAAVGVSSRLPGEHRVSVDSVDSWSGGARQVASEGASPSGDDLRLAAVEHLQRLRPLFGLSDEADSQFEADARVLTTSSGAVSVHSQQSFDGIRVFQAGQTVVFAPDLSVRTTIGYVSPSTRGVAEPTRSPDSAVVQAGQLLANGLREDAQAPTPAETAWLLDLAGFSEADVRPSSESVGPTRRTTFLAPPFSGPIEAELLWFDTGNGLTLCWEVLMGLPDGFERYRVIIDATTGGPLYSKPTTLHVQARGNVAFPDPRTARQMIDFPLHLSSYGFTRIPSVPKEFPGQWVTTDGTDGANVRSLLSVPAPASGPPALGTKVDGILTFDPAHQAGDEQQRVTSFYVSNYMHDLLYMLGFRENDGNFQTKGVGTPDPMVIAVLSTPLPNGAFINVEPSDGKYPTMFLDPFGGMNGRHTALDATAVIHEYAHGLSIRLVGGYSSKANLANVQSASMGEGWGDYFACTLTNSVVVGAWLQGNAGGIRSFPYDEAFPDHFGKLGTGRYNEVHNNGEIWCAALLELNRRIGVEVTMQVIVDGMKLTPSNPTYLEARDAILHALTDMGLAKNWDFGYRELINRQAWRAFARFGMGAHAKSGSSIDYAGIAADFTVPDYPTTVYAVTDARFDPQTGKSTPRGDLLWYRHDGRGKGTQAWTSRVDGVGRGWGNFSKVFGGGEGVLYAITPERVDERTQEVVHGKLHWYRHEGWRDGNKNQWNTRRTPLSFDWGRYVHAFADGAGAIYTVDNNGDLKWRRHLGWRDGNDNWKASLDERVGHGWNGYTQVLSGGNGIIYAVTEQVVAADRGEIKGPDLVWFRHDGWRAGVDRWAPQGHQVVWRGWNGVETISGGDGVLYVRHANGDLTWFRHDGWFDGSKAWAPGSGKQVGTNWFFERTLSS